MWFHVKIPKQLFGVLKLWLIYEIDEKRFTFIKWVLMEIAHEFPWLTSILTSKR